MLKVSWEKPKMLPGWDWTLEVHLEARIWKKRWETLQMEWWSFWPSFPSNQTGVGRICSTAVSVKMEKSFSHPQQKKTVYFFEEFGGSFPGVGCKLFEYHHPLYPPNPLPLTLHSFCQQPRFVCLPKISLLSLVLPPLVPHFCRILPGHSLGIQEPVLAH